MKNQIHTCFFRRNFYVALILSLSYCCFAQDKVPSKYRPNNLIYAGAVVPFYSNNPYHTIDTQGAFSFNAGYKKIIRVLEGSFECGVEYVNEGLSFKSYYFAPGYSKLYDKTFPYTHDVRMNELQIPLLFRHTFNKENKHKATPYFTAGWALRILMYSSTSIQSIADGTEVYSGQTDLSFQYPFPWNNFGSLLQGGLGLQFNNIQTQSALFFELNYKLGISAFHYTGANASNDLIIKDSNLTINVGYKF